MRVPAAALTCPPRAAARGATAPPAWLEFVFYVQVFYSVMGPALGLSFGSLGILMLGIVGGGCVLAMGRYSIAIMRSVVLPVACGLSSVAIQILVHGSSLNNGYVREWIPWMAGIVVLQHLALRRGFLHRACIVMFLIGASTLPFIESFGTEHRMGLAATITIANPNDFGAWFGFCCVYFAILGFEARRQWVRAVAWSLAVACLLILGLSVSRAPLVAAAISIVFAMRRVLKTGVLPLLFLGAAGWVTFALGLFNQSAELYAERGLEESGRLLVWPLAIERFLGSPLAGVGAGNIATYVPEAGSYLTPHNGLIFIALASGIVPLLLFIGWCMQLVVSTYRASPALDADSPFHRALLLYAFLIIMNLNSAFSLPCMMVVFGSVSAAGLVATARRSVTDEMRGARVRARPHTVAVAGQRPL
jgi:hypothetical protein